MANPAEVTIGDAPERLNSRPGYNGNRVPTTVALAAGVSSAEQVSGADFSGAHTERVAVFFYFDPTAGAAALDSFRIHFGVTGLGAAVATDMAFPARQLVALVVNAKSPQFRAISTVAGTLYWYAGA